MIATLALGRPDWLWPVAALLVLGAAVALWGILRARRGVRIPCLLLKLLGLALLAACLLEPLWTSSRPKPGANIIALVADDSASLRIHDRGAATSRGEGLREALTRPDAQWPGALAEKFQIRRYLMGARLDNAESFAALKFDGAATALAAALQTLARRHAGQPLAGALVFTDGNATDHAGAAPILDGLPPIYPVVVGGAEPARDVAIEHVAVSVSAFEDAPVSVQATVAAPGCVGEKIELQLLDESGAVVARASAVAAAEPMALRLEARPKKPGVAFFTLEATPLNGEATLENNRRLLAVNRRKEPARVLYVAGRPSWEFKFLNRALAEDEQIKLVALIRIAEREQKFDWRGSKAAGGLGNPLFQHQQGTADSERYDQPVLVRLGTRDAAELRAGFPATAEELFAYDAVILDDIEAAFFTHEQMRLLQRFVSERGGGFLMLAGRESFAGGKWQRTPVADVLPVYLDQMPSRGVRGLRLALTREGWLAPWARLRAEEGEEKARLAAMPEFQVGNAAREVKPGASVIATVVDVQNVERPALIAQRYGLGRAAALTIGDMWRWGFRDEKYLADMNKAWRQMIRWLVADVPRPVELAAQRREGGAVALQVRARGKKFEPLDNADVKITVTPQEGEFAHMTAAASLEEPGLYEETFLPVEPGFYKAEATVTDRDDASRPAEQAEAGWTVEPLAEEFRSLTPNRGLLEAIARQTGGEVVELAGLDDFVARLPSRAMPVMEHTSRPLWHQGWVFALALGCFVAEWGLRRWRGLP